MSETDIQALVSLILTQSPNASRDVLAEFFRATAEPLDFAIRSIVGMDAKAVAERFCEFARQAPDAHGEANAISSACCKITSRVTARSRSTVSMSNRSRSSTLTASTASSSSEDEVDDLLRSSRPSDRLLPDNPNPIIRTKGLNRNGHGRTETSHRRALDGILAGRNHQSADRDRADHVPDVCAAARYQRDAR